MFWHQSSIYFSGSFCNLFFFVIHPNFQNFKSITITIFLAMSDNRYYTNYTVTIGLNIITGSVIVNDVNAECNYEVSKPKNDHSFSHLCLFFLLMTFFICPYCCWMRLHLHFFQEIFIAVTDSIEQNVHLWTAVHYI